jgi:hypothetical protein
MKRIQAIATRAVTVLVIGAALAAAHASLAAAQEGALSAKRDLPEAAGSSGRLRSDTLADYCYVEVELVRSARGKTIAVRTQECD